MALQVDYDYKGYTANYWAITQTRWDKGSNRTSCTLTLFKDKAERDESLSNALPVQRRFSFEGDLSIEQLYVNIKEQEVQSDFEGDRVNIFADAVDC